MDIENTIKKESHFLTEFKFEAGDVLRGVKVEYGTLGTPKYDKYGRVINAIVYCHGSSGSYKSVRRINEITGPGEVIDTDKFFIISMSTLGSPGSASPSTTSLGYNFPKYNIKDMVNFQIKFLKEKYRINHIIGVIGNSMGGFEALTWATEYPDFMDFTISLASSYKTAGHNYALSKFMNHIIETDPDYNEGKYSKKLARSLRLASESVYTFGQSKSYYRECSNDEIDEEMIMLAEEGVLDDPNDLIYNNNASLNYDIEKDLGKLKSKLLIIAIEGDEFFPPELDGIPLHNIVSGSELIIFKSLHGHLGSYELKQVSDKIEDFLKEFKE
ncbi:alpha/beta fold hydrolase [Methanobrevibacter acididurans]|uniref:alpha/beta fold hydrolase n=1 Tax=Methanobrevibacter acididurans TaxID=120963 RepID=UPI0038FBEF66